MELKKIKDGNEWQICYSNILIHYSNVFEYSDREIEISTRRDVGVSSGKKPEEVKQIPSEAISLLSKRLLLPLSPTKSPQKNTQAFWCNKGPKSVF